MEWTFTLPIGPSTNALYRKAKRHLYLGPEATQFYHDGRVLMLAQGIRCPAGDEDWTPLALALRLVYYFKRRVEDSDNYDKATIDCIANHMRFDDARIIYRECYRFVDEREPRVDVAIWEVDGDKWLAEKLELTRSATSSSRTRKR